MTVLKIEYLPSIETIEINHSSCEGNVLFRVHGDYSWNLFVGNEVVGKINNSNPIWHSSQGKQKVALHRLGMAYEFHVDIQGDVLIDLFMGLFVKKAKISHFTVKHIEPETILNVQVLGVRTAADTKFGIFVDTHYNFSVYSLMINYSTGRRQVVECRPDSEMFTKLLPFITTKL